MKKFFISSFLVCVVLLSSTVSADIFSKQKQDVISAINKSYNKSTQILNQFESLIQKQRKAQKQLDQLRAGMEANNTGYCYKSLLQTTQKNIKLMSNNKQQMVRKKVLLSNLRVQAYKSRDIFGLNKIISKINMYNQQTNLLIRKTNDLDALWTNGVKNSCSVYLK